MHMCNLEPQPGRQYSMFCQLVGQHHVGRQSGSLQRILAMRLLHDRTYSHLISTKCEIPHLGEIRLRYAPSGAMQSLATCRNQQSTNSSHVPGHILEPRRIRVIL